MILKYIDNLILEVLETNSNIISLNFDKDTNEKFAEIISKYNIPNPTKNFHITLLKTNKEILNIPKKNYKLDLVLDDLYDITIETWYSNKKQFPDKRLIVIQFRSQELSKLRRHLINILQLPFKNIVRNTTGLYHITLSYNIGPKEKYPILKEEIKLFDLKINNFSFL